MAQISHQMFLLGHIILIQLICFGPQVTLQLTSQSLPQKTTEYWLDVTTNGVTCREYVSINVTAPAAPAGDAEQTFCDAATVADLTATGDNIQWYDAATGGNLLDSTTALTDGQMVYASQIVNGCGKHRPIRGYSFYSRHYHHSICYRSMCWGRSNSKC